MFGAEIEPEDRVAVSSEVDEEVRAPVEEDEELEEEEEVSACACA